MPFENGILRYVFICFFVEHQVLIWNNQLPWRVNRNTNIGQCIPNKTIKVRLRHNNTKGDQKMIRIQNNITHRLLGWAKKHLKRGNTASSGGHKSEYFQMTRQKAPPVSKDW